MKRLFAKLIWKLYQATLPKKDFRDGMELAFNLQGHNYYAYQDFSKLPPERLKRYQQLLVMIDKGFSQDEYNLIVDTGLDAATLMVESMTANRRLDGANCVMWSLQELKSRKDDLLFHPHLTMEVAALVILRDDESKPNFINEDIHKEKARLFLVHGGQLDFFTVNGIGRFIPTLKEFLTGFAERLEIELKKVKLFNETLEKIAGEVKSLKSNSNGKMT